MHKKLTVSLYSFGCYTELVDSITLYNFFQELFLINKIDLGIRLYKRYIKRNDTRVTIDYLKNVASKLKKNHRVLINSLIRACEYGSEGSELSLRSFGEYEPLRLVILDEPYCTISDYIPLEDYDNNEGEPFWMRPDYLIEKYGKKAGL